MKPIIVHSMGRCGSRSIYQALRHNGYTVKHCHYLTVQKREGDKAGHKFIMENNKDVFVILPVREPIARNKSAYFHNYTNHNVNDFVEAFPPEMYQNWFDAEILGYWGVDVFSKRLVNGWNIYNNILVIRLEDFGQWSEAFEALTGQTPPPVMTEGVTNGGGGYEYVKNMDVSQDYMEAMQKTRYYQHFYRKGE